MSAVTMAAVAAGAAAAGWAAASARHCPTHIPAPRRRLPRRVAVQASPTGALQPGAGDRTSGLAPPLLATAAFRPLTCRRRSPCAGPAGGGFDSLGAADSTVRQVSQLQRQESDFKAQLDTLKAAAMEANAAAVAAAQQAASGTGRLFPGQAGDGGLRERLEGAVSAMQAGLIERDTEVCARAGPGGWCVGGWPGGAWSNPSPVRAAWVPAVSA